MLDCQQLLLDMVTVCYRIWCRQKILRLIPIKTCMLVSTNEFTNFFLNSNVMFSFYQGSDFENAVMYVSWALYSLNESEVIEGLYSWCANSLNLSFPFLKALSLQAAQKFVYKPTM